MIETEATRPEKPDGAGPIRRLIASDGWAVLAAGAATVIVELGTYFAARGAGAAVLPAALATLAASAVWIAIAAPVFAAGARTALGALVRGGIVADASAVTLAVLWCAARDPQTSQSCMSVPGALKIYCTFAAVTLTGIAAVRCARTPAGRFSLAVATGLILTAALASPLWVGGLLKNTDGTVQRNIVAGAVYFNPFYSITSAIAGQTHFVWHQASFMYQLTWIGDLAAPPPVPWYASTVIYAPLAGILSGIALLRSKD